MPAFCQAYHSGGGRKSNNPSHTLAAIISGILAAAAAPAVVGAEGGKPELEQLTFFANAGYDLGNGARLYGWAGYQDREARSAGFFRPARDARNVIEIYPDGFLPIIAPDVTDYSLAGGVE